MHVFALPGMQTLSTVDLYEDLSPLEPSDLISFTQQIASGMVPHHKHVLCIKKSTPIYIALQTHCHSHVPLE